jgi:hypothetical protein
MGRASRRRAARRAARGQATRLGPARGASLPATPAAGFAIPAPIQAIPALPQLAPGPADGLPVHRPAAAAGAPLPPVDRLQILVARQRAGQLEMEAEIRTLLMAGHTWVTIGAVLGVTRQGARQRYRHLGADAV